MKILVIDENRALDLALKLQTNGHEVRYIKEGDTGNKLVVTYSSWKDRIGWSELVIFTGHGHSTYVEVLKRKDKPIIGVTKFLSQLKHDVVFRNQVLTGLKLRVAEHEYFTTYDDAMQYLNQERSYTLKPLIDSMNLYVSETAEDMTAMMEYMRTSIKAPEFILEKTPDGIPLEVGAWYNGFKFIRPILNVIGNSLRFTKTNRLFGETLIYLDPYLRNSKYTGYVGLKCLIKKDEKPIVEDITFGFPVPLLQLQDQIMKEDWGSFLFNLTQGTLSTIKVMPRWCYAIELFAENVPIFLNETEKFSHLVECMRISNHLHSTGKLPVIACGHAMTIKEAHRRALEVANSIGANNKKYSMAEPIELEHYKQLKKLGYCDVMA